MRNYYKTADNRATYSQVGEPQKGDFLQKLGFYINEKVWDPHLDP